MSVFATQAKVHVDAFDITPLSVEITADESWSPYYQGTIVFGTIFTGTMLAAIDPRVWGQVRVTLTKSDDVDGLVNPVTIMNAYLIVRSYDIDPIAGTTTIKVASKEAMLQDAANATTTDIARGSQTMSQLVTYALAQVGEGPVSSTIGGSFVSPATIWQAGQTLDSWLDGMLRGANAVLWHDPETSPGSWQATTADNPARQLGTIAAVQGTNIARIRYGVDVDHSGWADSAVAIYNWTVAGAAQKRAYASKGASVRKTLVTSYNTPDPGFDPSVSMRTVAGRLGLSMDLDILADRYIRTGYTVNVALDSGNFTGVARTITWRFPESTIGITLAGTVQV